MSLIMFRQPTKSPKRNLNLNFLLQFFVCASLSLFLLSCGAQKKSSSVEVGVPDGPQQSSSIEAFVQGLQYIRQNPTQREDERVQRYLWLDQWVNILEQKGRLNEKLAQEFWDDLTSFVTNPALSGFALQKIVERAETALGANVAYYQLYSNALRDSSVENALSFLNFIKEDRISDLYERSQQLLQLSSAKEISESRKIGVLLPLSGDLKSFGEEALHAVQIVADLAYSEGIEFVVEDVGTTDDQLLEAFQSLVLEENVTALVGPLTASKSEFVFERAQILRVPVVSLALTEDLEIFGDYNFRSALTLKDQVGAVASFVRRDLKARNTAILFPDTSYGWDVAKLAESRFKQEGLSIKDIQVYEKGQTDFKSPLQKMTRLDFPKLREDELCQDGQEPEPGTCVKSLDDLPPILEFEVLFVPETSPDTAGLLMPTLPFLGIQGVQVIGLSGFHSDKLMKRAGDSAENVIFTDGFYLGSENLATTEFVNRYKALTEKEPSNLAAEAFDASLFLTDLLRRSNGPMTRDRMQQAVRSLRNFEGVTGELYADGQEIRKSPRFFTVRDGDFKELR